MRGPPHCLTLRLNFSGVRFFRYQTMISVEDALHKILDVFVPLGQEKVNILNSLGRVIGEDIYAARNIPPKNNSAMDGYALRWEDTRGASKRSPSFSMSSKICPPGLFLKRLSAKASHRGS